MSFNLAGTRFQYTRGTYSAGTQIWLANASGANKFDISTNVTLNKSITTNPDAGGGSKTRVQQTPAGEPFTPNELDTKNINDFYQSTDDFYYYINQELYSLTANLIMLPTKIVITDELPAGIALKRNSKSDVVLYNARSELNNRAEPITVPNSQVQLNTNNTTGRTTVAVTLLKDQIEALRFDGGFFSLRLAVKLTENPAKHLTMFTMVNRAHVQMWGSDDQAETPAYDRWTDKVRVWIQANPVDVAFTKVDQTGAELAGAEFALYDEDGKVASSTANGATIRFIKVAPGAYTLKETKAPTGFQLPDEGIPIVITDDGDIEWPPGYGPDNQFENHLKLFDIELTKTNGESRLTGATFTLERLTGGVVEVGAGTTVDGKLSLTAKYLTPDQYRLTETAAPDGYQLLAAPIEFTLTGAGDITAVEWAASGLKESQVKVTTTLNAEGNNRLAITLENAPVTHGLPVTGGPGYGWQWLVASGLMLAAAAWWHRRNRQEVR